MSSNDTFSPNEFELNFARLILADKFNPKNLIDPFISFYENELLETFPRSHLELYLKGHCEPYWLTYLCCLVPYLVLDVIRMQTCTLILHGPKFIHDRIRSTMLILRPTSLHFKLDESFPFDYNLAQPTCYYSPESREKKRFRYELVIPLMDTRFSYEISNNPCFGLCTFQVLFQGYPIICLESNFQSAQEFIEKLHIQIKDCKKKDHQLERIPKRVLNQHEDILNFFLATSKALELFWMVNREKEEDLMITRFEGFLYHPKVLTIIQAALPKAAAEEEEETNEIKGEKLEVNELLFSSSTGKIVLQKLKDTGGIWLQKYCHLFEKHNIDGKSLLEMDEVSLEKLGIHSSLDRKRLLAWRTRSFGVNAM